MFHLWVLQDVPIGQGKELLGDLQAPESQVGLGLAIPKNEKGNQPLLIQNVT
jgi:hypothetical protein